MTATSLPPSPNRTCGFLASGSRNAVLRFASRGLPFGVHGKVDQAIVIVKAFVAVSFPVLFSGLGVFLPQPSPDACSGCLRSSESRSWRSVPPRSTGFWPRAMRRPASPGLSPGPLDCLKAQRPACSGLAPAPELCPSGSGCRYLALRAFRNKPRVTPKETKLFYPKVSFFIEATQNRQLFVLHPFPTPPTEPHKQRRKNSLKTVPRWSRTTI